MGIVVPFPVANKGPVITALGHSESDLDTACTNEQERQMAQMRDKLRLIVEELEAIQREVVGVVASS